MAIDSINEVIPVLDEVVPFTTDYFLNISERNNALVTDVFPSINTFTSEFNVSVGQINTALAQYTVQIGLISNYVIVSEQNKNDAQSYASASETSYQNTVTLLENVDIQGTGGYTVDAVDNLLDDKELEDFINFN